MKRRINIHVEITEVDEHGDVVRTNTDSASQIFRPIKFQYATPAVQEMARMCAEDAFQAWEEDWTTAGRQVDPPPSDESVKLSSLHDGTWQPRKREMGVSYLGNGSLFIQCACGHEYTVPIPAVGETLEAMCPKGCLHGIEIDRRMQFNLIRKETPGGKERI